MDVPALIAQSLKCVNGNQAELARRLGRSETTVSRWVTGRNGIDYESCLRLARITGIPAREVVNAAGLDPELLLPYPDAGAALSPIELDVRQRARRVQELVSATEGVPDDFVETYVRKVLDRAESEITDILSLTIRLLTRPAAREINQRIAVLPPLEVVRIALSARLGA